MSAISAGYEAEAQGQALSDVIAHTTAHASRSIMLPELTLLFDAVPPRSPKESYEQAVLEENVLLKRTQSNRRKSLKALRQLYALDDSYSPFKALRTFWALEQQAQPLLALLTAVSRDEILRTSVETVLPLPVATPVAPDLLGQAVADSFPERFGPETLKSIGRHLATSWARAGHFDGKMRKVRSKAKATPAAAAYALLLGTLMGRRGLLLFESLPCRVLDTTEAEIDALAFTASQRGWFRYKRMGDVVEFDFRTLLASLEATE